eukprot:m.203961 g.203961  ORF g.203961 m.203961 type:complete len:581 (-) comp25298_c0_seq1:111-1853(-)
MSPLVRGLVLLAVGSILIDGVVGATVTATESDSGAVSGRGNRAGTNLSDDVADTSYVEHAGWVGVYHTAPPDAVADGHGTSAYNAGKWGIVAPVNAPDDGGFKFRDDVTFLCQGLNQKGAGPPPGGINAVYGMLIAASEGGIFSNPNDTDTYNPLPMLTRGPDRKFIPGSAGPLGPGGLLQGAARWSKLAQSDCAVVAGVVIDDFWSNYDHGVPPAPPPPPGTPCPECPADHRYRYGNGAAGYYCCPWVASDHCVAPPHTPAVPPCCLLPGTSSGCQSIARCGTNAANHTMCGGGTGGSKLSFDQLSDIKAALSGKRVYPNGTVDHTSLSLTPWLKLFVVTYNGDIAALAEQPLIQNEVVDGISFWISGPSQDADNAQLATLIKQVRANLPLNFPVFAGGYLTYSSIGWMQPEPFYSVLNTSIDLYDSNEIQGFYVFAGTVLSDSNSTLKGSRSHMNATEWKRWDIGNRLAAVTAPYLGTVDVLVVDEASVPLYGVVGTVVYNGSTHVTRKVTSEAPCVIHPAACFSFGGWTGKATARNHTIALSKRGYANLTVAIKVVADAQTPLTLAMTKLPDPIQHL